MSRPPPRPTLFPYTTLFRSLYGFALREAGQSQKAEAPFGEALRRCPDEPVYLRALAELKSEMGRHADALRSEEHTSVLQSPVHLVCRLLLEKKKQTKHTS